jgi:hypothetical protein
VKFQDQLIKHDQTTIRKALLTKYIRGVDLQGYEVQGGSATLYSQHHFEFEFVAERDALGAILGDARFDLAGFIEGIYVDGRYLHAASLIETLSSRVIRDTPLRTTKL